MLHTGNRKHYSTGYEWTTNFKGYEKQAATGPDFGIGSPLLARTHFGGMSPLHGMVGKDGETPEQTKNASHSDSCSY